MREVSTIKDSDSLRAWLEALPQGTEVERDEARRWAVAIAHRAAMRVLVKVWSISIRSSGSSRPFEAMPSILANIGLNVLFQGREISLEEIVARLEALSLSDQRNGVLPHLAAKIALDAYAADFHTDLFSCVGNAVNAASFHSGGQSSAFWAAVRSDCRAILKRQSFTESPLWESNSSFLASWSELMPRILAQGEGWRFWVDWYDNALQGRAQDYDLLTKIALIEPDDWDKGADHVNALIADIRVKHLAETRPLGEDAIDQGADGVWHRVGRTDIDRDILQDACDSVRDEIARIRATLQTPSGNMFTALIADIDLLDERIARYPERPLRLHDTFLRVQANILYNLEHDELPDDVMVRDLNSVLGTAAMDMRNACPKTKSVVEARVSARFDEADENARAELALVADAAASRSDLELGEEFKADKATAFDPAVPENEKKAALHRLTTRLSLMVTRDPKNIIGAVVLLGGIGAGVTTFRDILLAILRFVIF